MKITIYREIKPSHYVGSDVGITVSHKMKDTIEAMSIIAEIEETLNRTHQVELYERMERSK